MLVMSLSERCIVCKVFSVLFVHGITIYHLLLVENCLLLILNIFEIYQRGKVRIENLQPRYANNPLWFNLALANMKHVSGYVR